MDDLDLTLIKPDNKEDEFAMKKIEKLRHIIPLADEITQHTFKYGNFTFVWENTLFTTRVFVRLIKYRHFDLTYLGVNDLKEYSTTLNSGSHIEDLSSIVNSFVDAVIRHDSLNPPVKLALDIVELIRDFGIKPKVQLEDIQHLLDARS